MANSWQESVTPSGDFGRYKLSALASGPIEYTVLEASDGTAYNKMTGRYLIKSIRRYKKLSLRSVN
jgi:hypothetical protein